MVHGRLFGGDGQRLLEEFDGIVEPLRRLRDTGQPDAGVDRPVIELQRLFVMRCRLVDVFSQEMTEPEVQA